jgi:hypothetical protein
MNPDNAPILSGQWKCKRCGQIVDMEKFRCGCKESPSPWEPVLENTEVPESRDGQNSNNKSAESACDSAH